LYAPAPSVVAKLIVEHVQDGIVLTDPAGKVVWINPAFTRFSGYDLDDMLGKRPGDVLQGERTSAESKSRIGAAMATHTHCKVDIVNYSKTGDAYIAEINLGPIFDEDGHLTHFVAVQRDVTSERALAQESADFKAYRQALDQQAIISMTDVEGKITYANARFNSVSGYTAAELIGQTHRIVNSGTHDNAFFQNMWRAIRTGETWHDDIRNVSKTGELYWVDTAIVPVHGPSGEIERYVSIRYEITERKAVEEKLRHMAETDALTGLANRTRFTMDLEQAIARAQDDPEDAGGFVVMLDLDHFKELNDSLGHHFGDLLLKETARRLRELTGPDCIVARLGGDEFAALIPVAVVGPDPEGYIRNLHASVGNAVSLSDVVYMPHFSIGVTQFPKDARTVEGLLINADVALYEAKRNGRNQACFFDPAVRRKLDYRNQLKAMLIDALDNDRFEIAMQPYYCIPTGKHHGFEVLARLNDRGTPVPPEHFIPLAEEVGLIGRIGWAVREKAMVARRKMVDLGLAPGKLSVNVAAPEFRQIDFVDSIEESMFDNALSPGDLVIEITETALIGRSTDLVAKALHRLQEIGVQVALDDFCTGFSSLSLLRDFHVNRIKIDKSFVQHLESDENDRALVEGLIVLARRIGIEVVAEGVETPAQLEYLRDHGCHYLQGFINSRPLTIKEAVNFLQSPRTNLQPPP